MDQVLFVDELASTVKKSGPEKVCMKKALLALNQENNDSKYGRGSAHTRPRGQRVVQPSVTGDMDVDVPRPRFLSFGAADERERKLPFFSPRFGRAPHLKGAPWRRRLTAGSCVRLLFRPPLSSRAPAMSRCRARLCYAFVHKGRAVRMA